MGADTRWDDRRGHLESQRKTVALKLRPASKVEKRVGLEVRQTKRSIILRQIKQMTSIT